MKFSKIAAASVAMAMIGGTALAQDGNACVGFGVDAVEFDSYNLSAKAGYNFTKFLGVEAQGGFGVADDEERFAGITTKAGVDYYVSGFATGRIPASESFELIGRVGYYFAEYGGSVAGTNLVAAEISTDVDGFAVGAGAQFNFGKKKRDGIRAEYTYLDVDTNGFTGSGDLFTLAYICKF